MQIAIQNLLYVYFEILSTYRITKMTNQKPKYMQTANEIEILLMVIDKPCINIKPHIFTRTNIQKKKLQMIK